jgi:uncharacterized phage protein (TIGR02220 family)
MSAPRPAGERAQEIVDKWSGQGAIHAVLGADELARLRHYIAAALTATHEAAVSPVAPMVCRVCGAPATMVVLNDYCDAHDPDEAHEAARREAERALEEHLVGCDAEALEWALTKANSRAQAAEAALAQARAAQAPLRTLRLHERHDARRPGLRPDRDSAGPRPPRPARGGEGVRERAQAMLAIEDIMVNLSPEDRALIAFDIYRTYGNTALNTTLNTPLNTPLNTVLNTGVNTRARGVKRRVKSVDNTVDNTENTTATLVFSGAGGALGGVPAVASSAVTALASKQQTALELLEFLNLKAGRSYRPVEENLRFIRARLNTVTPDDIRGVIARKTREWLNTDMAKYLRPATLFNATKFEQYMGEQKHA